MKKKNILIIGSGLVGSSLALFLLKKTDKSIMILEKFSFYNSPQNNYYIALNKSSIKIYKYYKIWEKIKYYSYKVSSLNISEQDRYFNINFDSKEEFQLGYIVNKSILLDIIKKEIIIYKKKKLLEIQDNIKKYFFVLKAQNYSIVNINGINYMFDIIFFSNNISTTKYFNNEIYYKTFDYHQTILSCIIKTNISHNKTAYEKITRIGPCALLPIKKNDFFIIWSIKNSFLIKNPINKLNIKNIFSTYYQYNINNILLIKNINFIPIKSYFNNYKFLHNFIFIGNSWQILHPVAAQGFNFHLRDINFFSNSIKKYKHLNIQVIKKNYLYSKERILDKYIIRYITFILSFYFYYKRNDCISFVVNNFLYFSFSKNNILKKTFLKIMSGDYINNEK